MPRWFLWAGLLAVVLSWVPLAFFWRERSAPQKSPRMQIIPDMDKQQKFRPQRPNVMFADGRADRRPPEGTVARGEARTDDHFHLGRTNGGWATTLPVPATESLMRRGQERFGIYCAPCHGLSGYGDGMVAKRADRLQEGTWVPPASLHDDLVRSRPVGHLYNTITNGIRNMPAYGPQIPEHDRWAIVAYVRALQRARNATLEDVPPGVRPTLR